MTERLLFTSSLHPTIERKGSVCVCLPTPHCPPILTGSSFRPSRVRNRESDVSRKGTASLGSSVCKLAPSLENMWTTPASFSWLHLQETPSCNSPHAFIISSLAGYFQFLPHCPGQLLVLPLFGDYLLHWTVISERSKMAPTGSLLRKHTVHSWFSFQHCNC